MRYARTERTREREARRPIPTAEEAAILGRYAEGDSPAHIARTEEITYRQVQMLIERYQMPRREGFYPGDRPHHIAAHQIAEGPDTLLDAALARLARWNAEDAARGGSAFTPVAVERAA